MNNLSPNDPPDLFALKNSIYELTTSLNQDDAQNEDKIQKFDNFLHSSLKYFHNNKKYPNQIPCDIFYYTLEFSKFLHFDVSKFSKILSVLNASYDPTNKTKNFKIESKKLKESLFEKLLNSNQQQNISETIKKEIGIFFLSLTKSQISTQEFISKDGALFIILDIIINSNANNTWITEILLQKIKDRSIEAKYSSDFCFYYSKIIPEPNKIIFLTSFFEKFAKKFNSMKTFSSNAHEKGAFEKFIYFLSQLDPKYWHFDDTFLKDSTINSDFLIVLYESCIKIPKIQERVFKIITIYYINRNKEVNTYFSIQNAISEFQLKFDEIINILTMLNESKSDLVKLCLKPIYVKLIAVQQQNDKKNNYSTNPTQLYHSLYEITYNQLKIESFTVEGLLSIGFIETFVIYINPNILLHLLGSFDSFSKLVLEMTKLLLSRTATTNDLITAEKVFQSFIKSSLFCDKEPLLTQQNRFCSDLLEMNPSKNNMKVLLNFMLTNKTKKVLNILYSTISKIQVGQVFIKTNGLEWLEKIFEMKLIQIETYSTLLANLVLNQRFEEVDTFLLKLQQEKYFGKKNQNEIHPLFLSNIRYIEQIVYGMNHSVNKPIRVYSLFHFLETPKEIDPYNAWMLGKKSLNLLINENRSIFDIPLIQHIGNRYINSQHVDMLLSTNPYNIRQFCDKFRYDHFPLYQFYYGMDNLKIDDTFSAISFWFKFSGEMKENNLFFLTNHLALSIHNQEELMIYFVSEQTPSLPNISPQTTKGQGDKILAKMKINPFIWNVIYIQKVDHFRSTTVTFYLNQYKNIHSETQTFETNIPFRLKFKTACFRSFSNGLMFLGPSIRLFSHFDKNSLQNNQLFQLIRKYGPGYTSKVKDGDNFFLNTSSDIYNSNNLSSSCKIENETVYLATEIELQKKNVSVPSSCFLVPYFGFPNHFISIQKMSTLFKLLNECETKEKFNDMFFTILSINSITRVNSRMFWSTLLDILHAVSNTNPSFITQKIIIFLIQEISYQKAYRYNNSLLTRLFYNLKIWNSVDKDDLIQAIFKHIQDIDINVAIPDFCYFLSDLVLKNPKSQEIILTLLKHHEKVPIAISNISNFLFIDKVQAFTKSEKEDNVNYINDPIEPKFMLQLKDTIISAISEFLSDETVVCVVEKFFPFNKLNMFLYRFLTNNNINKENENLAFKVLHLIYQISKSDPKYFEESPFIMLNTIHLASQKMILQDVNNLICGNYNLTLEKCLNENALFLILIVMWTNFIISSYTELCEPEKMQNTKYFFDNCCLAFEYCMKYPNKIIKSQKCLMILTMWFPIAIKSVLTIKYTVANCTQTDSNPEETNNQFWKNIYYYNNSSKDKSIIDYFIGLVLDNYHIKINDKNYIKNISDEQILNNIWFKKIIDNYTNLLIIIIFKIKTTSVPLTLSSNKTQTNNKNGAQLFNQLFMTYSLCAPTFTDLWIKHNSLQYINLFIKLIISKLKSNESFGFMDQFFQFVKLILGKTADCDEMQTLAELLLQNNYFTDNYSKHVDEILFVIFKNAKNENVKKLLSFFSANQHKFTKIIHLSKDENTNIDSSFAWIYCIYLKNLEKENTRELILRFNLVPDKDKPAFEKFLSTDEEPFSSEDDKYLNKIRNEYTSKTINYQNFFDEISRKNLEQHIFYINYMFEFTENIKNSIYQHEEDLLNNKKIIEKQIKDLEVSLFLFYEERNWDNFMNELKLKSSNISSFNPSSYLISSQCLPYLFPKLRKPFILPNGLLQTENKLVELFERRFTINFEMDALKNIKTIKMKQTASQSLCTLVEEINSNVLKDSGEGSNENRLDVFNCFKNHFQMQFGQIERCVNCYITLYGVLDIPSVLFVFVNSTIMILTYAGMKTDTKDWNIKLLNDKTKESDFQPFITFVFNQQFGRTTLFFSHIVINLSLTDIIKTNINFNSKNSCDFRFLIWTFSSGHLVLSIRNSNVDQIKEIFEKSSGIKNINNYTEKSIPDFLLLSKIKSTEIAIDYWLEQIINNEELIFYLNGTKCNSFVSFSIFPVFPSICGLKGENAFQNTMLSIFNSFSVKDTLKEENDNEIDLNDAQQSCSTFEFHQEEFALNSRNIQNFLLKEFRISLNQNQKKKNYQFIADFNSMHINQNIDTKSIFTIKMNQSNQTNDDFNLKKIVFIQNSLFYLSKLETSLSNFFVVRIVRESMKLQILKICFESSSSSQTGELIIRNEFQKQLSYTEVYSKMDPVFSIAKSVSSSKDGLYIVVDFEFGISRAYRVFYSTESGSSSSSSLSTPVAVVISSEILLRDLGNKDCCESCVSGHYSVAASCDGKDRIALWYTQHTMSSMCFQSSSQTFWASPAGIHRLININKCETKLGGGRKEDNKSRTNENEESCATEIETNNKSENKINSKDKNNNEENNNNEKTNSENNNTEASNINNDSNNNNNEISSNKETRNNSENSNSETNNNNNDNSNNEETRNNNEANNNNNEISSNEETRNNKETNNNNNDISSNEETRNNKETNNNNNEISSNEETRNNNEANNNDNDISSSTNVENNDPSSSSSSPHICTVSDELVAFKLDESDGVWAVSTTRLIYFSLNAVRIAELELKTLTEAGHVKGDRNLLVTAIDVCSSPLNEPFAVIGFDSGELILASPRFDNRQIETKVLNSPHKTRITSINVEKRRCGAFVAVDKHQNVTFWSTFNGSPEILNSTHYVMCAVCKRREARVVCASCNMGICSCCCHNAEAGLNFKQSPSTKCLVCSSFEHFLS